MTRAEEVEAETEGVEELSDEDSDYAEPFEAKSFGGQFVWADKDSFQAKILRVRAGEKVIISTRGRKDMVIMLTGGRGLLEVIANGEVDKRELEPAEPVDIEEGPDYRLVAVTEVELFTIHADADPE